MTPNPLPVFSSLHAAKLEGYEVYDRAPTAFIVSRRKGAGYELAVVCAHAYEPQPKNRPKSA